MSKSLTVVLPFLVVILAVMGSSAQTTDTKAAVDVGNDVGDGVDKRQIMPVARVGRSVAYPKRQSLIPAPRIGRRASGKAGSGRDCSANPEQCENYNSGYRNSHDAELVEPLGIQLRAAFIPRLGKRSLYDGDETALDEVDTELVDNGNAALFKRIPPSARHRYPMPLAQRRADDFEEEDDDEEAAELTPEQQAYIRAILMQTKRAMPYTPRIGRAVFAPRIGKKATFVPRIG